MPTVLTKNQQQDIIRKAIKGELNKAEVTKTTIQELQILHPNNTHINNTKETIVFDDRNLRGGFAQVPNVVLYDPLLGASGKVCYVLLLSYAWQSERCFPSQKLLAENMSCTVRTTIRALKDLQKRKLIIIEKPGQGKPNIYHIRKLSDGYLPKQYIDK